MLIRRELLVCIVLLFLAVMGSLALSMHSSPPLLRQQVVHAGHAASSRQAQSEARAVSALTCPCAPAAPSNAPFLDFCSPRYAGNAAGPYGSHIVLLGENLPGVPNAWFIGTNQIATLAATTACIRPNASCSKLSSPELRGVSGSIPLYGWTWNQSNGFPTPPTTPTNYFIMAVVKQQVVATPISFTLLTSKLPCIILKDGHGDTTTCSPSSQPFPLPSGTTQLTIIGSNWILGWGQHPRTETVTISAICNTPSACHHDSIFTSITVSAQFIDATGNFSIPVPVQLQEAGNYQLSASDQVTQVATPGLSDTSGTNANTVADASLTFTEVVTIPKPPVTPIPSPAPTRPPVHPTPPPTKTIDIPGVNIDVLDKTALVGGLLSILGIIVFLCLKLLEWLMPESGLASDSQAPGQSNQPAPAASSPAHYQPPLASTYQQPSPSPSGKNQPVRQPVKHEFPLVPFPPPVSFQHRGNGFCARYARKYYEKKINKAVEEWRKNGKLEQAKAVASKAITENFDAWLNLHDKLKRAENRPSAIPPDLEQKAAEEIQQLANRKDDQIVPQACSAALVYCAALPPFQPQKSAIIGFEMGYAYLTLASVTPRTSDRLLDMAEQEFTRAKQAYNPDNDFELYVKALIAIGDVNFALAQLPESLPATHLAQASKYYEQANNINSHMPGLAGRLQETRRRNV